MLKVHSDVLVIGWGDCVLVIETSEKECQIGAIRLKNVKNCIFDPNALDIFAGESALKSFALVKFELCWEGLNEEFVSS